MHAERLRAVQRRLSLRQMEAWVLVPGPNLFYLTGWAAHPSERLVLAVFPREGEPFLFVPHLEAEAARAATGIERVVSYRDESGPQPALARALAPWALKGCVFGAEFGTMRVFERTAVNGVCPKVRWTDIGGDLLQVRQEKDAGEIDLLARAAEIAVAAVEAGRQALRPGAAEADVRRACAQVLLNADTTSPFGIMVASGPRSAQPHAPVGERVLEDGDLCWIDLGAVVGGYRADITRTFTVGSPAPELLAAYRAVAAAQEAGCAAARPGLAAAEIDRTARRVIAAAGFGEYFTHRTGHGLGLEDHEWPLIADGNGDPLRPGMVFTVEPGVYLPGRGGIRIEDDLVVTADGCRILTSYRRNWLS